MHRGSACGAYQARFAPMPGNLKTAVWAAHNPFVARKIQRVTPIGRAAYLACLLPPHGVMPVSRAYQSMRNLMQYGIADVVTISVAHIMARQ